MRTLAVAALALFGIAANFKGEVKLGEVVPDITLKDLDGKDVKLADFRGEKGKVTVIYFQSKKCPSALKADVVKKVAEPWTKDDSKVKFIAVFAYHGDNEDIAKSYRGDNELKYTCVYDKEHKVTEHLGAKKVNTTYVLDRDGKLVYRGAFTAKRKDLVAEAVTAALEGKKAPDSDGKFAG